MTQTINANPEKLLCVRRMADGMPFKMAVSEAKNLIKDKPSEFVLTTKNYTRSFYRRMAQTLRNQEAIKAENVDFSTDQKYNFVEQEGNKGIKTIQVEIPKDAVEAEAKKSWIKELVERACINPNDHSLREGILAKLAIFFGFLVKKKVKRNTQEAVDLPQYQRYTYGYGSVKDIANLRLA
jgi:hypothetical protein